MQKRSRATDRFFIIEGCHELTQDLDDPFYYEDGLTLFDDVSWLWPHIGNINLADIFNDTGIEPQRVKEFYESFDMEPVPFVFTMLGLDDPRDWLPKLPIQSALLD